MAQGQDFLSSVSAAGGMNLQNVITNLQNVVIAINALTQTIASQFTVDHVYTVATLPVVGAPTRAFVSDSSVAGSGNFGAAVVGGGSNYVPVYWDTISWKIG